MNNKNVVRIDAKKLLLIGSTTKAYRVSGIRQKKRQYTKIDTPLVLAPPGACSGGGREAASSRIATHSSKVGFSRLRDCRMSRTRSCTAFQRFLNAALSAPRLDLQVSMGRVRGTISQRSSTLIVQYTLPHTWYTATWEKHDFKTTESA